MGLDIRIGGDQSKTRSDVEAVLHKAYDDVLGIHEVTLHYSSGSGYRVMSAVKRMFGGGAYKPGDTFKEGTTTDISAEVTALLRREGIQVQE